MLEELSRVDCLVLLGDVIELRQRPVRDALRCAEPVLRQIGAALGPEGEVVLVPGNHDHHLIAAWFERRARKAPPPPLGLDSAVDWKAGEPLATVIRALAPARARAAYPGTWVRPGVYATHGHYCDRHTTVPMFERLAAGAMARLTGEPDGGPERAEDYEATLGPVYAWIHALAQSGGPKLGESSHGPSARAWRSLTGDSRARSLRTRALIAAFPALIATLNRARLGPLRSDLSGAELRRAGLRAISAVLERLEVEAECVIFGHTHRAGPLPGEPAQEWRTAGGAQLVNCGSWVYEPQYLGDSPGTSPYRPGFRVLLEEDAPPMLANLLDGVTPPVPA